MTLKGGDVRSSEGAKSINIVVTTCVTSTNSENYVIRKFPKHAQDFTEIAFH